MRRRVDRRMLRKLRYAAGWFDILFYAPQLAIPPATGPFLVAPKLPVFASALQPLAASQPRNLRMRYQGALLDAMKPLSRAKQAGCD